MALPEVLQRAMRRPGMYFSPVEFDTAVAFLEGFDLAYGGGLLVGFREWLVVMLGFGNNLAWKELALQLIFAGAESPRECLTQPGQQKPAVESFFGCLEKFWKERERPNGLRQIFLNYQKWLEQQSWYGPSSPDYIDETLKH